MLKENGIAVFPDGDKLELFVPDELTVKATAIAKPPPANSGDELIPSGAIQLFNVDLSQALVIYGAFIGRKLAQPDRLPAGIHIYLVTQTPLSKAEAIHAFDVVFGWHGLKVVLAGKDSFKVIPVSSQ